MTEPIFVFGSFTEDEAKDFQISVPGSPSPKKVSPLKPAVKENGFHPPQSHSPQVRNSPEPRPSKVSATGQNGVSPASKGAQILNSRAVSNGKEPEYAGPSRTAGRGVRKSPATPSVGAGIQNAGKQGEVTASVEHVHNSRIGEDVFPGSENQEEWMLLSSQHVSDAKVTEANGQGPSYAVVTPLKNNCLVSRKSGSQLEASTCASVSSQLSTTPQKIPEVCQSVEKSSEGKEVLDATPSRTTSDADTEGVTSQFMSKSWAALVGVSSDAAEMLGTSDSTRRKSKDAQKRPSGPPQKQAAPITALSGDVWLTSLREADAAGRRIFPRGLVNTGNSCFVNATMQAMLSCPPFTHLLKVLKARGIPQLGYPTLRAFVDFFGEFEPSPDTNASKPSTGRREADGKISSVEVGRPFVPAMFDAIVQSFTPDQQPRAKGRNRQEDAQEFLSFVMDRMHEEILRLQSIDSPIFPASPVVSSIEDEDWEMVGPKNRTSVTRTHTFSESAVTDIFGGQLRSVVKTKGNKASATVQPFLLLHLDIVSESVHSVEDALRMFAGREYLEGYKPATGKVGAVVAASKSLKIQTLPRVLILHLMRFSYDSSGSSKIHKHVQFPLEVTLGRELLASPTGSGNEHRRYELVATVSHHGKDPSVGHYTADSKQASGQWLRFDDGNVSAVSVNRVLQEQVYVLFYKRLGV